MNSFKLLVGAEKVIFPIFTEIDPHVKENLKKVFTAFPMQLFRLHELAGAGHYDLRSDLVLLTRCQGDRLSFRWPTPSVGRNVRRCWSSLVQKR